MKMRSVCFKDILFNWKWNEKSQSGLSCNNVTLLSFSWCERCCRMMFLEPGGGISVDDQKDRAVPNALFILVISQLHNL